MRSLFALLAFVLPSVSFAAGAVSYSCVGKNLADDKSAVVFELMFSDHAREEGYTNESITILRSRGMELSKPVVFQMHGATERNACKSGRDGEIYLPGSRFEMLPTAEGDIAAYKILFKAACGGEKSFDVQAYCFFN